MARASAYHEQAAAKAQQQAEQVRTAEQALLANPAAAALFGGYDPASVTAFLRFYAERKVRWLADGPSRLAFHEKERLKYETEACERLWDIQQKKLFNLQCQWRAGLIRLSGVDVIDQFSYWGHRPDYCPPAVLPPVTATEVALYQDYLAGPACNDVGYRRGIRPDADHWQNYADLRPPKPGDEEYHHPKTYPAWYRYYDDYHGTGHLRDLPDVRGERQRFYEQLARAEQERLHPAHDDDTRPWPSYADKDALFDEFTRRFDPTPHLIELHRLHGEANWRHPDEDAAFMSSVVLDKEGNSLPLTEAYPDWRPALIDLANDIRRERLAAAMPAAFARYSLCIESGLRPPPPHEKPAFDEENPISFTRHRERVLRGRELNGEARDFEF